MTNSGWFPCGTIVCTVNCTCRNPPLGATVNNRCSTPPIVNETFGSVPTGAKFSGSPLTIRLTSSPYRAGRSGVIDTPKPAVTDETVATCCTTCVASGSATSAPDCNRSTTTPGVNPLGTVNVTTLFSTLTTCAGRSFTSS